MRMGTIDGERCHRCSGENVIWAAPSPLWNLVMRGNDIDGDPRYNDLVCIRCFVVLADEAGVSGRWRLCLDDEPAGLVKVTPSGRVWNPATWMWDEPEETTAWHFVTHRATVAEEIAAEIEKVRDDRLHGTIQTAVRAAYNHAALVARQVGGVPTSSGLGPVEEADDDA